MFGWAVFGRWHTWSGAGTRCLEVAHGVRQVPHVVWRWHTVSGGGTRCSARGTRGLALARGVWRWHTVFGRWHTWSGAGTRCLEVAHGVRQVAHVVWRWHAATAGRYRQVAHSVWLWHPDFGHHTRVRTRVPYRRSVCQRGGVCARCGRRASRRAAAEGWKPAHRVQSPAQTVCASHTASATRPHAVRNPRRPSAPRTRPCHAAHSDKSPAHSDKSPAHSDKSPAHSPSTRNTRSAPGARDLAEPSGGGRCGQPGRRTPRPSRAVRGSGPCPGRRR